MPDKKNDAELAINLHQYPNILKFLMKGDIVAQTTLREWLLLLDDCLGKEYHRISERELGLSLVSLVDQTIKAHFDYRGITAFANNPQEAEMLAVLKWDNNPLSFVTGGKMPVDLKGNTIPVREFLGVDKIDLKHYLQKLMYGARYMDASALVNYLSLGKYDLMQVEKNRHIERLLEIQPALNYQKKHDLIVGHFRKDTGFFDCGYADLNSMSCPACQIKKGWIVQGDLGYCENCKASFEHA